MRDNLLLSTDSYKASHFQQYPKGTQGMFSYLESRGGLYDKTVFFGLQYLLRRYLSNPITKEDVDEAEAFFKAHGTPFPRAGWDIVVNRHGGWLPVKIRAVREGSVVPTRNVLLTVQSTDPDCFWVVTWIESFLMRLWYPITVATQSWHIKSTILKYLQETSEDPASEIGFKLHDFGARGVSSSESAAIGGMAHLVSFMGSDTVEGVVAANRYYHSPMAAFSIPASEHSTITSWGKEHEKEAMWNMVEKFGGPGKLVACVSDSFDIFEATRWWASRYEDIAATGTKLVIRPDSGEPSVVVNQIMSILDSSGCMFTNNKSYRQLKPHIGVIQGDGVNHDEIAVILETMKLNGYSASNIAFGAGGALLQKVNRDTQKFAYKCSAVQVDGKWRDVFKDPVTDTGKKSKRGIIDLVLVDGKFTTVERNAWDSVLYVVYNEGVKLKDQTLDEIRGIADRSR